MYASELASQSKVSQYLRQFHRALRLTAPRSYYYYYYYYYFYYYYHHHHDCHHHYYYYYYYHGLPRREAIEAERRVRAVRQ